MKNVSKYCQQDLRRRIQRDSREPITIFTITFTVPVSNRGQAFPWGCKRKIRISAVFCQSAATRMHSATRNSTHLSFASSANLPWTWACRRSPSGRGNKWRERRQETVPPWNYLREHVSIAHRSRERNALPVARCHGERNSRRRSKSVLRWL